MSLIGEALKRARLEAARRDAEERGTVYSEAPAYVPQRRGLSRWPAAGVLLAGLALGVLVGTAIFLALRQARPTPGEIAASPREARPAPVAAAAEATSPPAPPIEALTAAAPSGPVAPPVAAGPAGSPPDPASPDTSTAAAIQAAPAAGRREAAPAAPPFASGRSYLRAVVLPSGGRLELDGIVASADAPLTMINRQLLSPGETVEGFTVERIEPNQVTLRRSDGVVVILRLRDVPAG
jgi:hypothetical protein